MFRMDLSDIGSRQLEHGTHFCQNLFLLWRFLNSSSLVEKEGPVTVSVNQEVLLFLVEDWCCSCHSFCRCYTLWLAVGGDGLLWGLLLQVLQSLRILYPGR